MTERIENLKSNRRSYLHEKIDDWSELTSDLFAAFFDKVQILRGKVEILEEEVDTLSQLNIILSQLHSSNNAEDIYEAIEEILREFVGVRSFLLGNCSSPDSNFKLLKEEPTGIIGAVNEEILHNRLEKVIASQEAYYSEKLMKLSQTDKSDPLLILPLHFDENDKTILVILKFLPQKTELHRVDFEIFSIFQEHVGIALEKLKMLKN